jgi:(2Fe-2S) ferredoxin
MGRRADKLYQRLEAALDAVNGDQYPKLVKLEIANCLSMCGTGPNLVLYPEGAAFHHLDDAALQVIVETYLSNKQSSNE